MFQGQSYFFAGALEKQKLVYILNRDSQARLTISSPLEAHKGNTLVYQMVGIDVGFENPMFACLELDYEEADNDPTGEVVQSTQQVLSCGAFGCLRDMLVLRCVGSAGQGRTQHMSKGGGGSKKNSIPQLRIQKILVGGMKF